CSPDSHGRQATSARCSLTTMCHSASPCRLPLLSAVTCPVTSRRPPPSSWEATRQSWPAASAGGPPNSSNARLRTSTSPHPLRLLLRRRCCRIGSRRKGLTGSTRDTARERWGIASVHALPLLRTGDGPFSQLTSPA